MPSGLEDSPTCYRAPGWPDPEFPQEIPKITPQPEILDSQNFAPKIPRKYRKHTKNIPRMPVLGTFCVLGVCWGFQKFGPRGISRYFRWKFRFGPSRGSVVSLGVLDSGPVRRTLLCKSGPSSCPFSYWAVFQGIFKRGDGPFS